jgi:hypothetical protein
MRVLRRSAFRKNGTNKMNIVAKVYRHFFLRLQRLQANQRIHKTRNALKIFLTTVVTLVLV